MSNVISVVQTIANLRTLTGTMDGDSVILDGYTTEGDGGGGIFYWDASSTTHDNGGTIIAPTGVTTGRWYRSFSGSLNVRWFGAMGNGTASDSSAIGACIGDVGSRAVYIPSGSYKIANNKTPNPLAILNYGNNLRIFGDGRGISHLLLDGSRTGALFQDYDYCTFIEFEGLTFDLGSVNNASYALGFGYGTNNTVHNCGIINAATFAVVLNSSNAFRIEHCYLERFAIENTYQTNAILCADHATTPVPVLKGFVTGNYLINWGTNFSGQDLHISNNIVDQFAFGAGIDNNDFPARVYRNLIIGNTLINGGVSVTVTGKTTNGTALITSVMPNSALSGTAMKSDNPISGTPLPSGTTVVSVSKLGDTITVSKNATATSTGVTFTVQENDMNNTAAEGMELWAPELLVAGNVCYNDAGNGITFCGERSAIFGNLCGNNGTYNGSNGIGVQWSDVSPKPTGSFTSGSHHVTVNSTDGIQVGYFISGTGIPANTYVTSITLATKEVYISNPTSFSDSNVTFLIQHPPARDCVVANNVLFNVGTPTQGYGYWERGAADAIFINNSVKGNNCQNNSLGDYNFSTHSSQPQFIGYVYEANASYTVPAIVAGAQNTGLSITVAGANLGDLVEVTCNASLKDLHASGYVKSTNAVQVLFMNNTSGSVTLGAVTIYVRVSEHRPT